MHQHPVRVTVDSGVVEGFTRDGVNRWRSIPYARPPVGPLRFRAPRPPEPWRGVRYCHAFANCAPQQRKYTLTGIGRYQTMGEDCLTLNVVTPQHPPSGPLPVLVFVHGGGYILGSSATPIYDGASLARNGCVYVSVNYRLGALGCLDLSSLGTAETPIDSNLFLRDLVLALQWVRDNIAVFGGDPHNVTIFGESAGAQAVATLLAVPAAEGLFSQVISESPASGLSCSVEQAQLIADRFAALLGTGRTDAARALHTVAAATLVDATDELIALANREMLGAFPVGPTYGDEVLPVEPLEAMRRGTAHRVPLIVGNNAEEARLFTRFLKLLPTTEPTIEALLAPVGTDVRTRITAAYPDYPSPAACLRLGGDFAFASAAWDLAEAHNVNAPTYRYRYDYAPRTLQWSGFGATHGTELLAVFDVYRTRFGSLLAAAGDQRSAARVTREVQSRWLTFGRTGVPGDGWPRYDHDNRSVLVFDRQTRVELDPDADRRTAWSGFSLSR
ncbi:MAG: carboxylesterase/lipase family protein [Mycobacterium sp.]